MIRGTEKRVIRVKCDPKCKIEEAFLIMKPGWETESRDSIVNEAEKIIFAFESKKRKKKRALPFLLSFSVLTVVSVLIYFAFR